MGTKNTPAMQISLPAMFAWVLVLSGVVAAVGAYPSSRFIKADGLIVEMISALLVLPLMLSSGILTFLASRKGPAWAASVFTSSGVIRLIACCALAAGVILAYDLPKIAMLIWVVIFYIAALAGEGIWLVRAIHRHVHVEALGSDHVTEED